MRFFLALLACFLLLFPASADPLLRAEEGGAALSVSLTASEIRSDAVSLTLSLNNPTESPLDLKLIVPAWNGVPALFEGRRFLLDFELQPGETREEKLTVLPDGPADAPESVSFRFSLDGRISGPVRFSVPDEKCDPAVFGGKDSSIFAEEVAAAKSPEFAPVTLENTVPAKIAADPESAEVQICQLREDGLLRKLAALPAQVDPDGKAHAVWSGLMPVAEAAPSFPIPVLETADASGTSWVIPVLDFYGADVCFSPMTVTVTKNAEGIRVSSQTAEAEEFGEAVYVPYDLFSEVTLSAPVLQLREENGALISEVRDVDSRSLPVSAPLRLMLLPAEDPSSLVYFFEYTLSDGSVRICPAAPVFPE